MSDKIKKGTLGDILFMSQIINVSDINAALEEQKRSGSRFGEALVNLGIVTQEDIDWALSNQLDIPYIRLKKEMFDPDAIRLVPVALARKFNLIPLIRAGNELNIAIADPLNKTAIETLEKQTGCSVNISVALIREIREMTDELYGPDVADSLGFSSSAFSPQVLDTINADTSGSKLLDYLLIFIIQNRLASLSLQPVGDQILITGRRSGSSRPFGTLALNHYPEFCLNLKKSSDTVQAGGATAAGVLTFLYRNLPLTFLVATMQGHGGDYVTIRMRVSSSVPSRLSELRLPESQAASFACLTGAKSGITFFASRNLQERDRFIDLMLEEMDSSGKTVIILGEGPGRMSKQFSNIPLPASEIERAHLIMDALEHDPDILVIEDATAVMPFTAACRAAMRGKRVLAGMEIRGTRNLLRHLLIYHQKNCFLPVFANGLVSFKGIHLLCPSCRVEYSPPAEELNAMRLEQAPTAFYRTTGCDACGHRGFSERRFLLDVLPFDDEFLRVFEQSADVSSLDNYLRLIGYHGIEDEGLRLLMAGEVSPEEYIGSIIL